MRWIQSENPCLPFRFCRLGYFRRGPLRKNVINLLFTIGVEFETDLYFNLYFERLGTWWIGNRPHLTFMSRRDK